MIHLCDENSRCELVCFFFGCVGLSRSGEVSLGLRKNMPEAFPHLDVLLVVSKQW